MKMWRMRGACWISKATRASAHTEICNTYCFFHVNGGFVNAPHCYVIVHCWPYFALVMAVVIEVAVAV